MHNQLFSLFLRYFNCVNFQDEGLPPEVIERLVRRPEDLPAHVEHNIKIYKSNALRILEVTFYL